MACSMVAREGLLATPSPRCSPLLPSVKGASFRSSKRTACAASAHSSAPAAGPLTQLAAAAQTAVAAWQQLRQRTEAARLALGPGAVMTMAAVLPGLGISDLLANKVFMSGFFGFLFAQVGKIFTERYKRGYWDLKAMVGPGGMPSSHSSLCSGVTTALAMTQGLGSPVFAACTAFTLVVMYDAMGVRRHAGMHAQVLNRVVDEIQYDVSLGSVADLELKEVLGHTPRQVICGGLLGVAVGILYCLYF